MADDFLSESVHALRAHNNRPIIGVLSQELSPKIRRDYSNFSSYIAASYIKFLESGGARVVPVLIGQSEDYYRNLMDQINGILLPGGGANTRIGNGYVDALKIIYRMAKELNDQGNYFPILGICLEFERMIYVEANCVPNRQRCSGNNIALPLRLHPYKKLNCTAVKRTSKLYREVSDDLISVMNLENVTGHFHNFCISKRALNSATNGNYRVLSLNEDENNTEFVSSAEHIHYPFFGLQFHPEKNMYEWSPTLAIPRTANAVKVGQYFANFFVNAARKNSNFFHTSSEESRNLIYNYSPIRTSGITFEQRYFFR